MFHIAHSLPGLVHVFGSLTCIFLEHWRHLQKDAKQNSKTNNSKSFHHFLQMDLYDGHFINAGTWGKISEDATN